MNPEKYIVKIPASVHWANGERVYGGRISIQVEAHSAEDALAVVERTINDFMKRVEKLEALHEHPGTVLTHYTKDKP